MRLTSLTRSARPRVSQARTTSRYFCNRATLSVRASSLPSSVKPRIKNGGRRSAGFISPNTTPSSSTQTRWPEEERSTASGTRSVMRTRKRSGNTLVTIARRTPGNRPNSTLRAERSARHTPVCATARRANPSISSAEVREAPVTSMPRT